LRTEGTSKSASPAVPPARFPVRWRLPSGQDLISFALATGCAAERLRRPEEEEAAAEAGIGRKRT